MAGVTMEICRRGQAHGCSVAWHDINQVLEAAIDAMPLR
jgi:hypothetical protein